MTHAYEVNFDGLVGPTHNYAGLSHGNIASEHNQGSTSRPREAALQGLQKMKTLHDKGLKQGVLPPQPRPNLELLRGLGFTGTPAQILERAAKEGPMFLHIAYSASSMWTANAATVSPSADTADGKVHFTPANLANKLHRAQEPATTAAILKSIFRDERYFCHHPALPTHEILGDEGAANHTRLCPAHHLPGVELFVFGRYAFDNSRHAPRRFPARQTRESCEAIARLHGLKPEKTVFAQQHPDAIDAGVFHNDVIAVGNGNALFYHANAFLDTEAVLSEIRQKYGEGELHFIRVEADSVTMEEAVQTYLFNSQLVSLPEGGMALVAPKECEENQAVRHYLSSLVADSSQPVREVHYMDVRESMRNGGGPACLRLRVALTEEELSHTHSGVLLTESLYRKLTGWVEKHYRETLAVSELRDPALYTECLTALDELTQILGLGSVYDFQKI
jgi:succinylarginine dihydrolase